MQWKLSMSRTPHTSNFLLKVSGKEMRTVSRITNIIDLKLKQHFLFHIIYLMVTFFFLFLICVYSQQTWDSISNFNTKQMWSWECWPKICNVAMHTYTIFTALFLKKSHTVRGAEFIVLTPRLTLKNAYSNRKVTLLLTFFITNNS